MLKLNLQDDSVDLGGSALNHEGVNDAVEGQAVIEAIAGQIQEIGHGDGGALISSSASMGKVRKMV